MFLNSLLEPTNFKPYDIQPIREKELAWLMSKSEKENIMHCSLTYVEKETARVKRENLRM